VVRLKECHSHLIGMTLVFVFAPLYVFMTTLRELTFDTEVYLNFYTSLLSSSISYSSCAGFEPFFCYISRLLIYMRFSSYEVHTFWACLVTLLILRAILFHPSKNFSKKYLLMLPLMLNFFNPTEIFFLTRQFIAGAFLLNFFVSNCSRQRAIWALLAVSTHFFVLPLILIFYVSSDFSFRRGVFFLLWSTLAALLFYFLLPNEFNLVRATLEYKFLHYQEKNDGGVSVFSEIKFMVYFGFSFLLGDRKVRFFIFFIFIFYILTFINPLLHLRYHKYLYFVFIYAFLNCVRLQRSQFMFFVTSLTLLRVNDVVKWITEGFGFGAMFGVIRSMLL
jgi:hypothetical protein